uniref:Uncharacterized protein n=1 Tax=Oryza sativa subsp. japonica TaxID=39947 RepID=Q6K321_ORYSJ|nr:hypothetical protein [Oryza sativa Japonica Group]BAD23549.1 hypothetical protein [Oryza sativa Japonica Group]
MSLPFPVLDPVFLHRARMAAHLPHSSASRTMSTAKDGNQDDGLVFCTHRPLDLGYKCAGNK